MLQKNAGNSVFSAMASQSLTGMGATGMAAWEGAACRASTLRGCHAAIGSYRTGIQNMMLEHDADSEQGERLPAALAVCHSSKVAATGSCSGVHCKLTVLTFEVLFRGALCLTSNKMTTTPRCSQVEPE